jgi:hypothetical protein
MAQAGHTERERKRREVYDNDDEKLDETVDTLDDLYARRSPLHQDKGLLKDE